MFEGGLFDNSVASRTRISRIVVCKLALTQPNFALTRESRLTMSLLDGATVDPKWAKFSIFQTVYKKVGDHGIRAYFLIPKSLRTENRKIPVITRFHGGALFFGESLYAPWFAQWALELAEKHNAVIACADYRLLPEATGVEILSDVDDWWKWLRSSETAQQLASLPIATTTTTTAAVAASAAPIELDLDRVITTGESAGGLLSVYLALTYPDEIRAATASYPMFNQDGAIDGVDGRTAQSTPQAKEEHQLEYQSLIASGAVVSNDASDARLEMAFRFIGGILSEAYARGSEASPLHRERLYQLQRLEKADTKLPRGGLVILHARSDPIVPVELSERFVRAARERLSGRQGADKIVLSVQEGEHGFDKDFGIEEPWLKEAFQTAISHWLE